MIAIPIGKTQELERRPAKLKSHQWSILVERKMRVMAKGNMAVVTTTTWRRMTQRRSYSRYSSFLEKIFIVVRIILKLIYTNY